MITDLGEEMADLGQQIVKLMGGLSQTGQAVATPLHQLVPGSVAMDGDIVGGAALVT